MDSIIVNLFCLAYGVIRKTLYKRTAGMAACVTAFYYLFVALFTYWTIPWISAKWYGFSALMALAIYIFCALSLRLSDAGIGTRPRKQVSAENMQLLMLQLQNSLYDMQPVLEERQYASLSRALSGLREWLEFSTPFGRSQQPVVQDMELQAFKRTTALLEQMKHLPAGG